MRRKFLFFYRFVPIFMRIDKILRAFYNYNTKKGLDMRQSEMDLLLAKGEYEVRSYFLCGASARTNNVDGTNMYVTNKRIVLEFMNNYELSRREIPIDQILFIKSQYYEEEETSSFADKCRNAAIIFFTFATLFLAIGVLGIIKIFDVFALFGLNIPLLNIIPMVIAIVFIVLGGVNVSKAKRFRPRVGKRLELLIGTTLDFDQGVSFTTDSTKTLRDNMRTYSGTAFNSLLGRVELSPTREAKKMINEIGALLIDIKAGMYDEDPEVREKREREAREKKKLEEAQERERQQRQKAQEANQKAALEATKKRREENMSKKETREPSKSELQREKEARMAKYGSLIEEEEWEPEVPRAVQQQFKKSKMPIPKKPEKRQKTEDELLEEEYQAVINSLNLD